MRARVGGLALAVLMGAAGCAPQPLLRPPSGRPLDTALLERDLAAYNRQAESVRVQGRLVVRGRGSSDFGARVQVGRGLRFDAVAGPFGTPVLAMACRWREDCVAYVPPRNRAYLWPGPDWQGWVDVILRGRVPEIGPAVAAWTLADGRNVLALAGAAGWREEVEFDGSSALPVRAVLIENGRPKVEVAYADHVQTASGAYPGRLAVRVGDASREYELVFRRVEPGNTLPERFLTLDLPPDTAVEIVTGATDWNQSGIPLLIPTQHPLRTHSETTARE